MSDVPVIHVRIFGTEYRIASEADPEHTREVARYVDLKMREIAKSLSLRSVTQIAVLTVLNLADELLKEEEEGRRMEQGVCKGVDRLVDSIDRT